jgi:hypothetical protein
LTPCSGTEASELHFTSLISPEKDSTLHTVKKQHQEGPDSSGLHAQSDQGTTKLKILNERESRDRHSHNSFPPSKGIARDIATWNWGPPCECMLALYVLLAVPAPLVVVSEWGFDDVDSDEPAGPPPTSFPNQACSCAQTATYPGPASLLNFVVFIWFA